MIYTSEQEAFAGGIGYASSAVVTYGPILDEMMKSRWKRVMVTATGALMNPGLISRGRVFRTLPRRYTGSARDGEGEGTMR
jgi:stage V sporulation protein AD